MIHVLILKAQTKYTSESDEVERNLYKLRNTTNKIRKSYHKNINDSREKKTNEKDEAIEQ